MNLINLKAKRATLLAELACYIPEWDEENTILLRMVAAKMLHENDVPREVAMTVNTVVKQAIALGYALRHYDDAYGIDRESREEFDLAAFHSACERIIAA